MSGGVAHVYRAERRKLAAQMSTRVLALVCVLGPFAFAGLLRLQSGSPADALFGVWVHSSGFAVSLVVLGFAGSWGFPLVAGVLAGDIFSAEDRYGTWKAVLTRSCTRKDLFVGKVLAAFTFSLALAALIAVASLLAGLVFIGDHAMVGLSGTLLSPGTCLALVLASWALCALPALAFTSLALLFSIATRNGIFGVLGPALVALVMQLLGLVGVGIWVHLLLLSSAFDGLYPLFTSHPFYGQLVIACVVSIAWSAASLTVSWRLLRKRDFAGTSVTRRPGWVTPVRVSLACAALIALLAVATNWGPVGVTATRLRSSISPTFNNLTLLQQRELGRDVTAGAKLEEIPSCSRRASTPQGPGDWICTLDVFIPEPGAVPFQQTPVNYDVSVQSDGCYKAESPPSFIGFQTMHDASGHTVVNPLYTIYGCLNTL